MSKFIAIGIIVYLLIGLVFLRVTITGLAKRKRKDPAYKVEYFGCTLFFAIFFWPILPLIYLVIGGVIKDLKKLKQEIDAVESLLAEEQKKVKQYEQLIETDPTTRYLFEDQLNESKRKCAKWEQDLTKLKAQFQKTK